MTSISLVAAVALNGVIGNSQTNQMPWHLPSDLKNFKDVTFGKTVVMGRRTFESLGSKPLEGRRNVVITSDARFRWRYKLPVYTSVSEALLKEKEDLYVIGGQKIFEEAIRLTPRAFYITIVLAKPEGDVKFPFDGYSFLGRFFMPATDFVLYHRRKCSDWIEENGFKFQITEFSRNYQTAR